MLTDNIRSRLVERNGSCQYTLLMHLVTYPINPPSQPTTPITSPPPLSPHPPSQPPFYTLPLSSLSLPPSHPPSHPPLHSVLWCDWVGGSLTIVTVSERNVIIWDTILGSKKNVLSNICGKEITACCLDDRQVQPYTVHLNPYTSNFTSTIYFILNLTLQPICFNPPSSPPHPHPSLSLYRGRSSSGTSQAQSASITRLNPLSRTPPIDLHPPPLTTPLTTAPFIYRGRSSSGTYQAPSASITRLPGC